ncbi:MAG: hypothetical protein SW833_04185 [Cyanobacteriota bacterium]|nr:hypothetical protein [Cyanobacteriota bacterium]
MVNFGYRFARAKGKFNRSLYSKILPQLVRRPIPQTRTVPISAYALSCERDLPEQVASIRSFLRHVGIPTTFAIISDGSYTQNSLNLLEQIHPCVKIIPLTQFAGTDLPQAVYTYAKQNPMGKKLAAILSIPVVGSTLYIDSDILFFPKAAELVELATARDRKSYYLPDETHALDERILKNDSEKVHPVNGGFILFKDNLDWSLAMERFLAMKTAPNYFTEQTMVHLTLHENHALPLCPRSYIMARDDEFIYRDRYAGDTIVLRHYVSPVRHKFWFDLTHLL